jgi:hypothetical protein
MVIIGSGISLGFGVWHFFVPSIWHWYSYIDQDATELHVAVRATNAFLSLSLVLFGGIGLLLVCGERSNGYSIGIVLAALSILWLVRVIFQIVYPQGSASPLLQYGMLTVFVIVFLCYAISLFLVCFNQMIASNK